MKYKKAMQSVFCAMKKLLGENHPIYKSFVECVQELHLELATKKNFP
jgi:hypothetical protein